MVGRVDRPRSAPIQFNADGTLSVDIYWDTSTVYRLEVRHGDSQVVTLTRLIENYMPVGGGGGATALPRILISMRGGGPGPSALSGSAVLTTTGTTILIAA